MCGTRAARARGGCGEGAWLCGRLRAGSPREVGKGSEKLGNLRDAQGGLEREGSASFRAAAGGRSLKGLSTGLPLWLVVLVVRSGDPIDP